MRVSACFATGFATLAFLRFGNNGAGEIGACGDEDGEGFGIVLGLRDEAEEAMSAALPFSLVTTISVGPASMSMAQSKATRRLAAVT